MTDPTPQTGLAAYLRADAPARERAILTLWMGASLLGIATGLAVVLTQKRDPIAIPLHVLFSISLLYMGGVRWALGRGWFYRAIIWANVTVEISEK